MVRFETTRKTLYGGRGGLGVLCLGLQTGVCRLCVDVCVKKTKKCLSASFRATCAEHGSCQIFFW